MAYEININGFIGDPGFFGGDYFSLKTLNDAIDAMPAGTTEINVLINSGGGYVSEGFAIHDRLVSLSQKVNTTVLGLCGSIATVIAQAGKKGTRSMYENSDYYLHNPGWSPQSGDPLEADELLNLAEDLKKAEDKIVAFYNTVTGTSEKVLRDKMDKAQTLTSDEAKSLGFVDEIIKTSISATRIYKIAAHFSKPNTAMENIEAKVNGILDGFAAKMKAMFTANAGAAPEPTPTPDPVVKTELELLKEENEALKAENEGLKTGKATEIETAVATAVETTKTETEIAVTAKLTTEFTAKMETAVNEIKNQLFTGDKLKEEFVQQIKGDGEAKKDWRSEVMAIREKTQK